MANSLSPWVSRAGWGAKPAKSITPIKAEAIKFLVVHYSGMDSDEQANHANCAGRVRGIQTFHMTSDQLIKGGASDIAYTWVVCKHGFIFQGRGWRRMPAATKNANSFTLAACFLGNDSKGRDDVTPEAKNAYRRLVKFMDARCPNMQGVRGHKDFTSTTCPGAELYRFAGVLDEAFFSHV